MFKLNQAATFRWPVEFNLPVEGGRFEKQTFDAEFKRQTSDQIKERQEREGMTDLVFCREVVVGWSGISDDGEDVPFSAAALEQVLQVPGAAGAMVQAFYAAVSGLKRKN